MVGTVVGGDRQRFDRPGDRDQVRRYHDFAILLVDIIATAFAVLLHLQSHQIADRLLAMRPAGETVDFEAAWTSNRTQRRLMAQHLRNALRLTELSSLFPASSSRGYVIAQAKMRRDA